MFPSFSILFDFDAFIDDDFSLVYGNPVLIRSKDGKYDCVLMSIEYYNRRKRLYEEQKEKLSATIAHTVPAEKDPGGKQI